MTVDRKFWQTGSKPAADCGATNLPVNLFVVLGTLYFGLAWLNAKEERFIERERESVVNAWASSLGQLPNEY